MRRNTLLVLLAVCFFSASGQSVRVGSWNLKDFGQSKTDENILFIANVVKRFDVIAIQEVVAGYGGPKAASKVLMTCPNEYSGRCHPCLFIRS